MTAALLLSLADWAYNAKCAKTTKRDVGYFFYNAPNTLTSDHRILVNGIYYTYTIPFIAPCN